MENKKIAISMKNVSKQYLLFEKPACWLAHLVFGYKPFRVKKAIDDISLEIGVGESVAFFGQNGAGKSTLLKMITGVAYPTYGTITVNGRVSALLELTAGFSGALTGRENIYFRGEILGIPKEEIQRVEEDILAFAELGSYIDQPVRTYSSGMKARLGFAISTGFRPDIIIVDEALSVGDANFRRKCLKKIAEQMEQGVTFLFVTHSLTQAKKFCKRGVVIERGKLFFDGDVVEASNFYDRVLGLR